MGMKNAIVKEMLCWALAFIAVVFCCALASGILLSQITSPIAYDGLIENPDFASGAVETVNTSLSYIANETGVPYEILKSHISDEQIMETLKDYTRKLPLLLSGELQGLATVIDEEALLTSIEEYYLAQMGSLPEGDSRAVLRAVSFGVEDVVNNAVRVPNVEAFNLVGILDFVGMLNIVSVLMLALAAFGLIKLSGKENSLMWLFGVTLCGAICLLIPVIAVPSMGMYNLGIRPQELRLAIEHIAAMSQWVFGLSGAVLFVASIAIYIIRKNRAKLPLPNNTVM